LSFNKQRLYKMLEFMVSFAVGVLFGDAFIHIIPEAFSHGSNQLLTSMLILAGIMMFFVTEKIMRWHHCHNPDADSHVQPIVALNLAGDGVHNFIDGLLIGASYIISIPIGIATTLAVIFHEIPQEIGDFAILVRGGLSIPKALFFNFLCALTAVAGAICSLVLGVRLAGYSQALLPVTAGGFIYLAGSDLIPEIQHRCDIKLAESLKQAVFIMLGIGVMLLLAIFSA